MTKTRSQTIANAISMLLMLAMTVSLVALPTVTAQSPLIMNVSGPVLLHSEVDIDLNGGPGPDEDVALFIKYPGRADFTLIGIYTTRSNGDLDVYDFDFNETGDFALKWALPPDFTEESNVVTIKCVTIDMLEKWKTYAFIGATPNPVGVGQEVLLHVGIMRALTRVDYGWDGLTVTVTRPDGKTETLGPFRTDATGGTGTIYVPTLTGNYTFQTHFPEQQTGAGKVAGGPITGTVMLASDSEILTLVVQSEPVPIWPGVALPTEYWTRPIDAQFHEWSPIAGHWLVETPANLYVPYNEDAPETAHVLWTKPFTTGGLAGAEMGDHSMECGDAYEGKLDDRFILMGKYYYIDGPYERPRLTHCIDLRTGEELWTKILRTDDGDEIDFCQLIYWDSYNYHGVFEYLWITQGSTWYGYDAFTGEQISEYENVPSGTNIYGPKGEIYRYDIDLANARMTMWNQSAMVSLQGSWGSAHDNRVGSRALDASSGSRYERAWALNISIPTGLTGSVRDVKLGDRVVGVDMTSEYLYRSDAVDLTDVTIWAFSLKPGSEGQLLFKKTWTPPAAISESKISFRIPAVSIDDGLVALTAKETRQHWGFSTETGELLWGPTESQHYLDYLSVNFGERAIIADGHLFSQSMSGICYAYDAQTGELAWTYEADDPYNQVLWSNQWHIRPLFVTDGKIYMGTTEHSPVDPKTKGGPFVCVDVETGDEIFRVDGMFRQTDWGGRAIIGDSIIVTQDTYDQRIYAIGKGPSATTVMASPKVLTHGGSVIVEGTVTDISPGTEEYALTARFPNGVPAVSEESMSDWMKYVYKQFPRPSNVTGAEVVLEVLDPNNNYYEVGRTTSDASGMFSVAFTPEVPGKYTVVASFAGNRGYYGSFAETAINVEEAPVATPEPTPMPVSTADLYLVPGIAGIIIAIAAVGAILMLMLRKR